MSLALDKRYSVPQGHDRPRSSPRACSARPTSASRPAATTRSSPAGDRIQITQSAVVLEKLISQFLFSKAQEERPRRRRSSAGTAAPRGRRSHISAATGNHDSNLRRAARGPAAALAAAQEAPDALVQARDRRGARDHQGRQGPADAATCARSPSWSRQKVLPNFDFARMTRLAVGKNWAQASDAAEGGAHQGVPHAARADLFDLARGRIATRRSR